MKQWDYKTMPAHMLDEAHLKKLGKDSWELITVIKKDGTGAQEAVFKRELPVDFI